MSFFESLGQGFLNTVEEITGFFTDNILISWLPEDIQIVIFSVSLVLLVITIKRAVIS